MLFVFAWFDVIWTDMYGGSWRADLNNILYIHSIQSPASVQGERVQRVADSEDWLYSNVASREKRETKKMGLVLATWPLLTSGTWSLQTCRNSRDSVEMGLDHLTFQRTELLQKERKKAGHREIQKDMGWWWLSTYDWGFCFHYWKILKRTTFLLVCPSWRLIRFSWNRCWVKPTFTKSTSEAWVIRLQSLHASRVAECCRYDQISFAFTTWVFSRRQKLAELKRRQDDATYRVAAAEKQRKMLAASLADGGLQISKRHDVAIARKCNFTGAFIAAGIRALCTSIACSDRFTRECGQTCV